VASWPNLRALVLVRGASNAPEDAVLLELKELREPGLKGFTSLTSHWNDARHRVRDTTRAAWARSDAEPFWGVASWLGMSVQIRRETRVHRNIRVTKLIGELGKPEALAEAATVLGALLAQVHCAPLSDAPTPAPAIAEVIGTRLAEFATEQAELAEAYADQVEEDWSLFRDALRKDGPLLGQTGWADLVGDPAPIKPWE
jgi:hypothetical protein